MGDGGKVGDTINAIVDPADATNVGYEWFTGASKDGLTDAIAGEDDAELLVTEDMLGKYIGVVVSGENGSTADAATAVAVRAADSSEIAVIAAEQTGSAKVQVTFVGDVTTSDKISVKKGSTDKEITSWAFDDEEGTTATLTMKDNLSAGTYTVTLTPADTKVAATSVDFTAVSATKATRIGFTNKYLVMANTDFDTGYCFIKGYNDFDEEITLSGITITAAPSESTSYDSTTGKITVKYTDPGFAVVKNVSVFAQYTGADGDVLTAQETLEVSTVGYPSEVEFGDLKKDGTMRDDGKLTIAELGSGKYYVELTTIIDQYGNELSAEDLNDLVEDKLLTVIPTANSPVFFGTNATPFTVVDGKTVMFITKGNNMPGTGSIMLTGAGGTFSKEIEVSDDPYIQTLTVDVPDVYQGEETDEFTFSAVDQYGDEIDLYNFCPLWSTYTQTLKFNDKNHLTQQETAIQAEQFGTWKVKKDTAKKVFHVTYVPYGQAKSMVTFTIITAGMDTKTQSVTIGEFGGANSIVPQGSSVQLDERNTTKNIAASIEFKDANGKKMNRTDAAYPSFLYDTTIKTDDSIDEDDYNGYYWTVSSAKLATNSYNGGQNPTAALADGFYDDNGEIGIGTNSAGNLNVNVANSAMTYYVSLLAKDTNGNYKVLNSQAFRFTYAPANTTATVKYTVEDVSKALLYAATDSTDSEEIKVKATNSAGESWILANDGQITLSPSAPFTSSKAVVNGKIATNFDDNTTDVVDVKVYVNGDPVDTVQIKYSNVTPKADSTEVKIATTDAANTGIAPEGKDWDTSTTDTDFNVVGDASMAGGIFKMTGVNGLGDVLTAKIKDQYGQVMTDTTVKVNGAEMATQTYTGEKNFVVSNGNKTVDITTDQYSTVNATKPAASTGKTVSTLGQLKAALAASKSDVPEIYATGGLDLSGLTIDRDLYYSGNNTGGTITAFTLDGGDLILNGSITMKAANAITLTDGDIYVESGATLTATDPFAMTKGDITVEGKLVLAADQPLGANNIYVNGGLLTTNSNITSTSTGAVVLGADAELDVTANKAITNLTISEDATTSAPAIVDATGAIVTVTNIDIDGHGMLAGGTIKAAATGAVIDISGNSLDLAPTTVLDLNGLTTPTYTSINLGNNKGTVIVGDEAGLTALLENTKTNGEINVAAAITLDAPITIASSNAVELNLGQNLNGTIRNTTADLTVTGAYTITAVENSGKLTVGDGATATVITTLSSTGGTTLLTDKAKIGAFTGSTGGQLTAEAGSIINTTTINQEGTVTITGTTSATDVKTAAKVEVVAGKVTGDTTEATSTALRAAMKEILGEDPAASIKITQENGQAVVKGCAYGYVSNLDKTATYDIIIKVGSKYYAAASDITGKQNIQLCYAGDLVGSTGKDGLGLESDYSDEKFNTITEMWIVASTTNIADGGTETAPTAYLVKVNFNTGEVVYPTV